MLNYEVPPWTLLCLILIEHTPVKLALAQEACLWTAVNEATLVSVAVWPAGFLSSKMSYVAKMSIEQSPGTQEWL